MRQVCQAGADEKLSARLPASDRSVLSIALRYRPVPSASSSLSKKEKLRRARTPRRAAEFTRRRGRRVNDGDSSLRTDSELSSTEPDRSDIDEDADITVASFDSRNRGHHRRQAVRVTGNFWLNLCRYTLGV